LHGVEQENTTMTEHRINTQNAAIISDGDEHSVMSPDDVTTAACG
jgi:hypothetical protein